MVGRIRIRDGMHVARGLRTAAIESQCVRIFNYYSDINNVWLLLDWVVWHRSIYTTIQKIELKSRYFNVTESLLLTKAAFIWLKK